MKIKNIIIYYPSFEQGGVEKIIENLISFFAKFKINVYLISSKNKNLNTFKKIKNLKLIAPNNNFFKFFPGRFSSSINCLKPLSKLLDKLDKKNTVIHSMQSSYAPILLSKIKNFKIVIRNSEDPISSIKYADNKISSYFIFLLRFIFYNFADKIITNSKTSSLSLKFFLFGLNKKKVKYIYNPYLTQKKITSSYKKFKKKNIILSVGRLTKQKNFKDLIYAFKNFNAKHRKYILNIIGKGHQMDYLKSIIKSEKLEKSVFLRGYIKNLDYEYKISKIFVLPSIYEGLGNVLIDALNFSVPCIATNCKSGPSEILSYGKGGLIVPIKDIKSLEKAMTKFADNYSLALKKLNYGKQKLFRFNCNKQSLKYLKTLESAL